MKRASTIAAAALLGLSLVSISATAASAAIACNAEGACWHVRRAYVYKPEYGIVVHDNNWRWGPGEHYVWREHGGRGYWRNGVWIRF
jgi:hypothetical protein